MPKTCRYMYTVEPQLWSQLVRHKVLFPRYCSFKDVSQYYLPHLCKYFICSEWHLMPFNYFSNVP